MKRTKKLAAVLISALLICATLATAVNVYYTYGGYYVDGGKYYGSYEDFQNNDPITDEWITGGRYVDSNGYLASGWKEVNGVEYYFGSNGQVIDSRYDGPYGYYRPYYDYYGSYYPYYYDGYYYNGRYYPYYGPYWDNPNLDPFGQFPDSLTNDGTPEVVEPSTSTSTSTGTSSNSGKSNPSMGGWIG